MSKRAAGRPVAWPAEEGTACSGLINAVTCICLHPLKHGANWDEKWKFEKNKLHLPGSETNPQAVIWRGSFYKIQKESSFIFNRSKKITGHNNYENKGEKHNNFWLLKQSPAKTVSSLELRVQRGVQYVNRNTHLRLVRKLRDKGVGTKVYLNH